MTTGAPAVTRRSALGLAAAAAAACALPALPGRASEPEHTDPGPLEVVSYEAVAERGCGVTRISTPWYSLTLEDGLFPQGAYWEYDEAGLGFDAQGATEACSVLRVYDRGSGELACAAYLASDHERREPPFGGDWAVAQSERVEGLSLYLACPVDHPADDSARDRSLERAVGLRNRLSANDRYTHLVRDPEAGTTAVETTRYRVTIPDDAFPQGWRYTFNDSLVDHMGSGYHVYEWLHIYPADSYSEACAFFATTGFCMQGEYAAQVVEGALAGSANELELVAYKPADYSARTYEEELELLAPFAEMVSFKEDSVLSPLAPAFSAWEDDGLRLVTPHYSVLVPTGSVGAGFAWTYGEGAPAEGLADGGRTHVAGVDLGDGASFEVFCRRGGSASENAVLSVCSAGLVSPDGLEVAVTAADGLDPADFIATVWRADVSSWEEYVSEQYFLYTVEEPGATRVVTPYYSVLVPEGVFGDSFAYWFNHGKHVRDVSYDGEMLHRLTFEFYRQGEVSGVFDVYCLRGDLPAGDGPAVFAHSGLISTDGLNVDALCTYVWKPGPDAPLYEMPYEEACAAVEEFARTIEPVPADVPVVERLRYTPYSEHPGEVNGERPLAG